MSAAVPPDTGKGSRQAKTRSVRTMPPSLPKWDRPPGLSHFFLTPKAIVRPADAVPLVGRFEPPGLGQMLLAGRFVERDAQARLVRNRDIALVDDRLVDTVHQVAPI